MNKLRNSILLILVLSSHLEASAFEWQSIGQTIKNVTNTFVQTLSSYFSPTITINGSGNTITKQIAISDVSAIDMSGMGTLIISQSDRESLSIEAEDNIMPYIIISVKNNTLQIRKQNNININTTKPIRFHVTVKNINTITASSSIRIKADDIKTRSLDISTSGSATIEARIQTKQLTVMSSGSSNITLDGHADTQKLTMGGSSHFNGSKLIGKTAEVTCTGSSRVKLNVTKKINGTVSGSASVAYRGNPKIDVAQAGSAKIRKVS